MQYLIYAAVFRKISKNSNDPDESSFSLFAKFIILNNNKIYFKLQQANFFDFFYG